MGRYDVPVVLLLDNTGSQNKNRFILASLQQMCVEGYCPEFRVHFLVVGHTKSPLDSLFGTFKQNARMFSKIVDIHALRHAVHRGTIRCTIASEVLAFRDYCNAAGVMRLEGITQFRYLAINKFGVRCKESSTTGEFTDLVDMRPSGNFSMSRALFTTPVDPTVNRLKGLRLSLCMLSAEERVYWDSYMANSAPGEVARRGVRKNKKGERSAVPGVVLSQEDVDELAADAADAAAVVQATPAAPQKKKRKQKAQDESPSQATGADSAAPSQGDAVADVLKLVVKRPRAAYLKKTFKNVAFKAPAAPERAESAAAANPVVPQPKAQEAKGNCRTGFG